MSASDAQQGVILERLLRHEATSRATRWLGRLSLSALILLLAWTLSFWKPPLPSLSLWDLQDPQRVTDWLQRVAGRSLLQVAVFLLLGWLVAIVAAWLIDRPPRRSPATTVLTLRARKPRQAKRGWLSRCVAVLCGRDPSWVGRVMLRLWLLAGHALAASGFLAGVIAASGIVAWALVDAAGWSIALDIGLALAGLCLGLWLAWWWMRGGHGRVALLWHGVVAFGLILAGGGWLYGLVLDDRPHDFPQVTVTSADKRRLVEMVQQNSERQDGNRVYHVTTDQLNQLLAWWITVESVDAKAKVELDTGRQLAWCSVRAPERLAPSRSYVNVAATGQCEIDGEQLELNLQSLDVGAVTVPRPLAQWLSRQVAQWVNNDPRNRALLLGVSAVVPHPFGVDIVLSDDGAPRRRLSQLLAQMYDYADVTPVVAEHLIALATIAGQARRGDELFEDAVRTVFATARERSRFRDPAEENRAAILALGIALGHVHLAVCVGDFRDAAVYSAIAGLPRFSRLRARPDWARHFWISAAVTTVSTDRVSDAIGLLKEELDADAGGSGFSLADLAADRAGTEFARAAIADRESARRVQQWVLADDTDLNDLMPPADDLPERLMDAELLEQFDGVGGPRFQQVLAEIDRRVDQLPWR